MFASILDIFVGVLLPVLSIAALGAAIQWRLRLNIQSLVRLNLYLFVPAFLYVKTAESTLTWPQIGGLSLAVLGPMALVGVAAWLIMRLRRASANTMSAIVVGGVFFNAANFGIPVAHLAFGDPGEEVQALVVMIVNSSFFFFGYGIIAMSQGKGWRGALGYFRLPMVYALVAGFIVRDTGWKPPVWADTAIHTVALGMVPIALVTLGAQMAGHPRLPRPRIIGPVLLIKMAILPVVTGLTAYALGLWPWPGAQLVLAAAAPTAVNTLLLTLELDGDAETAADSVFWTTVLSAVGVTVVLAVLTAMGAGPPG